MFFCEINATINMGKCALRVLEVYFLRNHYKAKPHYTDSLDAAALKVLFFLSFLIAFGALDSSQINKTK